MKQSGVGMASLIFGIIGIVLSCALIGVVPCIIGLILGIIGLLQKNKKHGAAIGGIICSVIGIGIFCVVLLCVHIYSNYMEEGKSTSITAEKIREEDYEFKNSEFDITEYSYETSNGDTNYLLVVKNNSPKTVYVSGDVVAYDKSENVLGVNKANVDALGSGEEQVMEFYFDGITEVDHFEYVMDYETDSYESVVADLETKETLRDKSVAITCTNNGKETAEFVKVYVLFFKENKLVDYNWTYIVDDDGCELKAGKTLTEELYSSEEFDNVVCYYSGRR